MLKVEEGVMSSLIYDIITIVQKLVDYIGDFWTYINTHTLGMFLNENIDLGIFDDVADWIIDLIFSDYVLDMRLVIFLMYGGLVTAVFISLVKIFK